MSPHTLPSQITLPNRCARLSLISMKGDMVSIKMSTAEHCRNEIYISFWTVSIQNWPRADLLIKRKEVLEASMSGTAMENQEYHDAAEVPL